MGENLTKHELLALKNSGARGLMHRFQHSDDPVIALFVGEFETAMDAEGERNEKADVLNLEIVDLKEVVKEKEKKIDQLHEKVDDLIEQLEVAA